MLQYVVFVLSEKNYTDTGTLPDLKHNESIYKLVCKDRQVPIAMYYQHKLASSPWLGIYKAANYK